MTRSGNWVVLCASLGLQLLGCGPTKATSTEAESSDPPNENSGSGDESSESSEPDPGDDSTETGEPVPECLDPDPSIPGAEAPQVEAAKLIAPNELQLTFTEEIACTDEVDPSQFRIGAFVHLGCDNPYGRDTDSYWHYLVREQLTHGDEMRVTGIQHGADPTQLHLALSAMFEGDPCEHDFGYSGSDCWVLEEQLFLAFSDTNGAPILDLGGEAMPPVNPEWVDAGMDSLADGIPHPVPIDCTFTSGGS